MKYELVHCLYCLINAPESYALAGEVNPVDSVWCVCWDSGEQRGEGDFSKGHLAHTRGDPGCGKEVCYPRHVQRGL